MSSVPTIRSLGRGLEVLRVISQEGAIKRSQIAKVVNLPYPTVNRIVYTLLDEGYLEFEKPRKLLRVTGRVQSLAQGFQGHNNLVEIASPLLIDLTKRLDWPMTVATRLGSSMIVRASTHDLTSMTFKHYYPGFVFSMLDSAAGRAYLAFCSEEEREICFRGIESADTNKFDHAISVARDGSEFERIKQLGVATSRFHHGPTVSRRNAALAAPIFNASGAYGSLAMIFFASAMTAEEAIERYADEIKSAALEITETLLAESPTA